MTQGQEVNVNPRKTSKKSNSVQPRIKSPRTVYFSFCHPDLNPGGAQAVAKMLHDEHILQHGEGSSLFIAANINIGPNRSPGSNLLQLKEFEFLYITNSFDYVYFTNFDYHGQKEIVELVRSFNPTVLHFHHFMAFGTDLVQAVIDEIPAKTIYTIHEHMLVCHNDGHLLQRGNNKICNKVSMARCATCMPEYRYDYFHQRMAHFKRLMDRFDVVTAVSRFTADVIADSMALKEIKVIPNGPHLPVPEDTELKLDVVSVAYIGQVHRTKGVHLVVDALKEICEEDPESAKRLSLTIWGAFVLEDYKAQIEKGLEALASAGAKVKLGGVYDSTNLANVLADANVVVVPSMWPESYCLTLDEAISLGKAIVCSDFPAARERYNEGESLKFAPPGSSSGIKKAINEYLHAGAVNISSTRKFSFRSAADIFNLYNNIYTEQA